MRQSFRCVNNIGHENEPMCSPNLRPIAEKQCNNQPCPRWKTEGWSRSCNVNCERQREIRCLDHTSKYN